MNFVPTPGKVTTVRADPRHAHLYTTEWRKEMKMKPALTGSDPEIRKERTPGTVSSEAT